ncbi:hypothetical protein [Desulforamulus ruminis]|uniref:hypothetical protein n=1 Tax=Desulforamulus ruminis TaxID=1564 RepID=UPI0023546F9D|nr:hypothetical protein [Desulforamulus ruminis]
MSAVLLTCFFAVVLWIQLPSLIKRKNFREIIAYSLMMIMGMVYSYAYLWDIKLPNPTHAVDAVFRPITKFLDHLLV